MFVMSDFQFERLEPRRMLAASFDVENNQVILGNGSEDLIAVICRSVVRAGGIAEGAQHGGAQQQPEAYEAGWKDTVLLMPLETVAVRSTRRQRPNPPTLASSPSPSLMR